jgi:hypothetical protein
MQKRITPETKAIAEAHILASKTGAFNPQPFSNKAELIENLKNGATYPQILREIEVRFASITSMLMSSMLDHTSEAYKKAIYKGFKSILQG